MKTNFPTWEHTKEWRQRRKSNFSLCIFVLLFCFPFSFFHCFLLHLSAQNTQSKEVLGVMFYNVENLFDTENDSLKRDDEYTPRGDKHWTYGRYNDKLRNISRVILEAGAWNPPALIGLCEVENKKVLTDLILKTGLHNLNYQVLHHESPDERGIDVALLYRDNIFTPLESIPIKVDFGEGMRATRDILYVFGYIHDSIPLHIFVVHFPSRYGGVQNTKPLRFKAAQILNDTIQSITSQEPDANIIAMGDFNDEAQDESMQYLERSGFIMNVSSPAQTISNSKGTLKFQYEWNTFDQFFISKSLSNSTRSFYAEAPMKILDFPFLLEKDNSFTGSRPFRTYVGYKYAGGFSDHFPIWLSLRLKKK